MQLAVFVCVETWLNGDIPDSVVEIPGFTVVRGTDEHRVVRGKERGLPSWSILNGVILNVTVGERICTLDIELLAVGLRPYCPPLEFSHVVTVVVYLPPSTVAVHTCDIFHSTELQTKHPRELIIINENLNHVSISKTLTTCTQYLDCKTRGNKTLDLLHANWKGAYNSHVLPPLGRSDQMIHLLPTYQTLSCHQPVTPRTIILLSREAEDELRTVYSL